MAYSLNNYCTIKFCKWTVLVYNLSSKTWSHVFGTQCIERSTRLSARPWHADTTVGFDKTQSSFSLFFSRWRRPRPPLVAYLAIVSIRLTAPRQWWASPNSDTIIYIVTESFWLPGYLIWTHGFGLKFREFSTIQLKTRSSAVTERPRTVSRR